MTGVLRKIMPVAPPKPEDDAVNLDYSFAMEYSGPPVSFDIPQVVPIDVGRVPVAAAVATATVSGAISVPVVQPIEKRRPLMKRLSKESNLGFEPSASVTWEKPLEWRVENGHDGPLSSKPDSFGTGKHSQCQNMSGEASKGIDSSGAVASNDRSELVDGVESSGTPCFTDSHDNSQESSECPGTLRLPEDCKKSAGFQQYLNPSNWNSEESSASSQVQSSEVSSHNGEDLGNGSPCNARTAVVTFRDPELSDSVYESEGKHAQKRPQRDKTVKKGLCYRCHKGNRVIRKEACIVCNAKYCRNCVLRAMGPMPEGRKCITCIGYPVHESKRAALGKCSSMLKQLFTKAEIKQILRAETTCQANCLPSEFVVVNGKPLCPEEMELLQNCSNPPKKLNPGNYWYDKVSGLWGKEGKKPCQIITPQLNVGDQIKRDASNGNTKILINGREITKVEVWMLKSAGVQCTGYPSFWVSADGSCVEEGHRNVKGPIWETTGTKLVCTLLSLPIPPEPEDLSGKRVKNGVVPGFIEHKLHKLLLVGYDRSGTSTLYKQAKILYGVPFSEAERENVKLIIQSSLYAYLGVLLEGRERFEKESLIATATSQSSDQPGPSDSSVKPIDGKNIYSIGRRLRSFSDWLLKVKASGNLDTMFPAATREYATFVEDLWKDGAIQATYNRKNELQMLPRAATYFLDRAIDISRTDYEPSEVDILYAEGVTLSNSVSCMEFSFPESAEDESMDRLYQHDPLSRFQLTRINPKCLGENCKWLEMFADAEVVLFCVALTDYDQYTDNGDGTSTNKMLLSKNLFESIVTHPSCCDKNFLLILNKFDLLEETIREVPLTRCDWFKDFNPIISNHHNNGNNGNPSLAQRAFHYIASKFKNEFKSLTGRKLYVSLVTGLEPDSVEETLKYAREIIKWEEEKPNFTANEWSSCSIDVSSTS